MTSRRKAGDATKRKEEGAKTTPSGKETVVWFHFILQPPLNRTDLRARLANSIIIGCAEAVFALGEYLFVLLFIITGVNYLLSGGSERSAQIFRQVISTLIFNNLLIR